MSTVMAGGSEKLGFTLLRHIPISANRARPCSGRGRATPSSTLARMSSDPAPWAGRPVAIVHDWFQGYHGSERVVEVLADDVLAEASRVDIFTFHAARELLPPPLAARIVRESRLSRLPGLRPGGHDPGRWRYLLPYMPHYFRSLDLSEYALVVVSSHACAINAAPPSGIP